MASYLKTLSSNYHLKLRFLVTTVPKLQNSDVKLSQKNTYLTLGNIKAFSTKTTKPKCIISLILDKKE